MKRGGTGLALPPVPSIGKFSRKKAQKAQKKEMAEKPKTELSARRVSRFFAMGFRMALDGRVEADLEKIPVEDDWQRGEMVAGYDRGNPNAETGNLKAHIQFWLVEGDFTHEQVEEKILITENTEGEKL